MSKERSKKTPAEKARNRVAVYMDDALYEYFSRKGEIRGRSVSTEIVRWCKRRRKVQKKLKDLADLSRALEKAEEAARKEKEKRVVAENQETDPRVIVTLLRCLKEFAEDELEWPEWIKPGLIEFVELFAGRTFGMEPEMIGEDDEYGDDEEDDDDDDDATIGKTGR